MINLYLKKNQGNYEEVYPDFSNAIKLTKENPYFTQSGSYTLDVVLPMANYANKRFFANLQRLESRKKSQIFDVKLMSDNKCILYGTAHITEVTQTQVKIQLIGGNSEVKFLSDFGDMLIRDINYPIGEPDSTGPISKTTGYAGKLGEYVYVPIYDETNEVLNNYMHAEFSRKAGQGETLETLEVQFDERILEAGKRLIPQLNLLYMIRCVVSSCGYTIKNNDIDTSPWNSIYVARVARNVKNSLPKWTVREFFEQVQYLFNCTFVFDDIDKSVDIINNKTFFTSGTLECEADEDYSVELSDIDERENKSVGSSNIEYDLSDSTEHSYTRVAQEIKKAFTIVEKDSYAEVLTQYSNDSAETRATTIYKCPEGSYCERKEKEDLSHEEPQPSTAYLQKIDQFGNLERSVDDDTITLKISPVATWLTMELNVIRVHIGGLIYEWEPTKVRVLSMPNTTETWGQGEFGPGGNDGGSGFSGGLPGSSGESSNNTTSVWDVIEGEELEELPEPEDRIQIFFVDCKPQKIIAQVGSYSPYGYHQAWLPNGFTDWSVKNIYNGNQEDITHTNYWSLGFSEKDGGVSLADIHGGNMSINTQSEYTIKFISRMMPNLRKIFMFNNRKFVCLKLEYTIQKDGLQPMITGYFYELES